MVSIASSLVSVTSRASMTVLVVGGVVRPTRSDRPLVGRRLLRCVVVAGVPLGGLACHRSVPVPLRSPLPVRETHLDRCQQGAGAEAAVCGARLPPTESRRPRHELRLQPAGVQVRPRPHRCTVAQLLCACASVCVRCRELSSTFSRLTQRVDLSEAELEGNIRQLSFRIQRLENIQRRSKAFRSEATLRGQADVSGSINSAEFCLSETEPQTWRRSWRPFLFSTCRETKEDQNQVQTSSPAADWTEAV